MNHVRWPRLLTPSHLSHIMKQQKNPLKALEIFNHSKLKYPNYKHNGPVYATMIEILGNAKHFREMKRVMEKMKEDSCECKDKVFAKIIRVYAEAGLLDDAIAVFEEIHEYNCANWTESLNTILKILLEKEKFDKARHVYVENHGKWEVTTNLKALNLFIDHLCKIRRSDLALEVFVEINEQNCYPDRETYRILMKGLCDDERLEEAIHLMYSMFWRISQKGSVEDIIVYRILLEKLCDMGRVDDALTLLSKVLKKGLRAPRRRCKVVDLGDKWKSVDEIKCLINEALLRGGVPSSQGYRASVDEFYREGKIDFASKILDEMRERGYRPPVLSYEAKIAALCREGRLEEGIRVVEEEMLHNNCIPTRRIFSLIIHELCKVKKSTKAVEYLEKMNCCVGCSADKEAYFLVVNGLCCEGQFLAASCLLDKMVDKKYWPSTDLFNRLIRGLCLIGKRYEALLWLEEMIDQGKVPEVSIWNSLAAAVCINKMDVKAYVDRLWMETMIEDCVEVTK